MHNIQQSSNQHCCSIILAKENFSKAGIWKFTWMSSAYRKLMTIEKYHCSNLELLRVLIWHRTIHMCWPVRPFECDQDNYCNLNKIITDSILTLSCNSSQTLTQYLSKVHMPSHLAHLPCCFDRLYCWDLIQQQWYSDVMLFPGPSSCMLHFQAPSLGLPILRLHYIRCKSASPKSKFLI